jgi:hypothetical protein
MYQAIPEAIISHTLNCLEVSFPMPSNMILQESVGDEQTSYTNSMLAHRARYSGRRDVADPGR